MARMYPREIAPHTPSNAEKRLFQEFRDQLPDDYIVMHGVGWLTRHRKWDEVGEADFVIAHPKRGVLVLEVKGGGIRGEWSSLEWVSIDRGGRAHAIKNPIKQAERSLWELKDKLADNPSTGAFRYPLYRGVAFPDVLVDDASFGVDWDRKLVIDSSDLYRLVRAVERMFSVQPPATPLSRDAMSGLVALLQPQVQIERRGLAAEMRDGDDAIVRLTEQQFQLLNFLQHHRQAVINGCAGSGKTLLAIEKAVRLAEQGFDVLLTCYNKNLSAWMRSVITREPAEVAGRIRVDHYHDLAVQLCREAGFPSTIRPNDQQYWDEGLSEDLARALPCLETRFDAIVADEGQDFAASWWITLQDLLRDPAGGTFYIFQDERQALYGRDTDLPFAAAPFALEMNCRSTAAIHRQVVTYYDGEPKPVSFGPDGRAIEHVDPGNERVQASLARVISRLVQEEGIGPGQIVVLTPNSPARSELGEGAAAGNLSLTWSPDPTSGQIRVSSIHGYKGLESDIVILAETARLAGSSSGQRLTYVALSRAKHHLVVIGNLPNPAAM